MRKPDRVATAVFVAAFAFLLYRATMLPGLELGDSASFQVRVGSPVVTPRDGYPLYFAIGSLFLRATGEDPARALNLASAALGAVAAGLIVVVAAELAGSVLAGAAAALLFAGSYTFWSQAVIAEVYTLHVLLVALTLLLLLRWSREPTTGRLAWFLAVYAASFGNHLSMILLAPAYAVFLFVAAPGGWRTMAAPRTVALAGGLAIAGAVQYLWNFSALWHAPAPPRDLLEAISAFWFDVTKSDWRDTMVLQLPSSEFVERLWMYAFDVRQQFGVVVPALAAAGAVHLVRTRPLHAALVFTAYGFGVMFALGYNVGDAHVFFLQSHLMLALLVAPGLVLIDQAVAARGAIVALALILAGTRIYRDYPALDRSNDHRPTEVLETLTSGLDDRHAVLLADFDWQVENGLNYFSTRTRSDFLYSRLADVMLYAPALIRDNVEIGRRVVAGDRARSRLEAAYGPMLSSTRDESVAVARLIDLLRDLPRGTPYVLCVLRPSREFSLDESDLSDSLRVLTGDRLSAAGPDDYRAVAGVLGAEPALTRSSPRPFRAAMSLGGVDIEVRMESWLAFDTIRRMGFGHVIAGHRHALIVERGVSFVAFDAGGRVVRSGYTSGIFAPQPRFIVQLAH
jgi:transmembrane protein TMEM260 (protein O-mannosyltransferase)